jgi:uncharacterized membrane protein
MTLLTDYWFATVVLLTGAGVLAWAYSRWKAGRGVAWGRLLVGGALLSFGLGGLIPPVEFGSGKEAFTLADVGFWIAVVLVVLFAVKLIVLFSTGQWWAPVAAGLAALFLLAFGAWAAQPIGRGLVTAGRTALSVEVVQPYWLVLLLLIPLIVKLSYRSLAGLGPTRRWLAIALRSLLILLLTLALAEVRLRRPNENTTVYFLVDRSVSIPQDVDPADELKKDQRWQRVRKFIADAVAKRGTGHERDQAGVIVFGRRPRLVLPASDVPKMTLEEDAAATIDPTYTDIAAAIKLALASFPEGMAKRIVLLSDGNENLGNAVEQARIAKENGVQIDAVALAAGYRNENEVLVERVEAPPLTEQGARLPIRVLIRSYNPRMVTGTLALRQLSEGAAAPVAIEAGPGVKERGPPAVVQLRPGLNAFSFRQTLEGVQKSYTYEAIFQPLESMTPRGDVVRGLAGDRVQNNSATTHVVALGRRRILLVEANEKPDEHRHLVDALHGMGDSKFQIATIKSAELPTAKADLGVFLSNYDCVVLANVPAEELNEEQQEMIRSNTYDQGCGLVMIGGRESFGAGGYQGTPVEKALPVDCDIKSIKVAGKGGLVLVMHACEAENGNALQKQIAKLSIQKLAPVDMVGMVYHDFTTKWHINFQTIGGNRGSILRQVDRMQPGDMPNFDPALQLAYQELSNPKHQLATKHCIIISDGDPQLTNQQILTQMKAAGITCTTVGVATHGAPENTRMQQMATATGGRAYLNPNPKAIPAIYIQETRIVSQSFLYETRFQPQLQVADGPAGRLPSALPPLHGFVRTSLKQNPLVTMAIEGPQTLDQRFPILAYWQYGLGKAVAFTSDAKTNGERLGWDREWAGSEMYLKFWEQVLGWALRGVETGKLALSTEYRDGKVRVTVDARDDRNRPLTDLRLSGLVTAPSSAADAKPIELKFEQKNSGQYEAEFKAEEAGSYFIHALAKRSVTTVKDGKEVVTEESDSVRSGVTLPYSPEFADLESNTALLRRLSDITGGNVYSEDDLDLIRVARDGVVFRPTNIAANSPQPIWYWLVLLAGVGLFFDVAVRRIAIEPVEVVAFSKTTWDKLRGRAVAAAGAPQFLERLQNRKAKVGEAIVRGSRRFDGEAVGAASAAHVPVADEVSRVSRPAAPRAQPKAPTVQEAPDTFARLMQAKRKALEERDAGKDAP